MSTLAIAKSAPVEIQEWKSPAQIKMRVQAIQQLMAEVLKPGDAKNDFSGDYGIIPGTGKKPSLWKSGSEQILAMFQIAVEPMVDDLSTVDCFRYRVTTRLTDHNGNFLGAGIGEASTDETKYKWRRTYNQKEFDSTPLDRRRIKYSQYKDAAGWVDKEEMQVRQEPADLANTILKMAKKRSQIDATLTVTGASSMFDQDLEDMTDEQKQAMQENRQVKRGKKAAPANMDVICADCRATNGHLPSCKHANKQTSPPTQPEAAKPSPQEAAASGLKKVAVLILGIERSNTKADAKGKTRPYMRLRVVAPDDTEGFLYVWHATPQEHLTDAVIDKPLLCEVLPKKQGDKDYYSVENILEVGGVPWSNNMPSPKDDDF